MSSSASPSPTVQRLREVCTAFIVGWEHLLQAVHSFLYVVFFYSYWPSQRAWWDPSKGAAIVITAPDNDAVARYLALRLSSGLPSSFAFKDLGLTKANPQAPYTCFVLHSDPDQFSITVAQWAARKAQIEKSRHKNSAAVGHSDSRATSPSVAHGSRGEEEFADKTSHKRQGRSRPPPIRIGSPSMNDQNHKHQRSRSWSSWVNPPDLFGYGADMLKGWRPGQGSKAESGTIIPIMADTQTQEGIAMVTSTISAYCTSHNLLLSGVILVPAVLCPRKISLDNLDEAGAGGRESTPPRESFERSSRGSSVGGICSPNSWHAQISPPASPGTARLKARQTDEHVALRSALFSDVLQSRALVNALYPAVRRDRGRIVALVPSGHGCSLSDNSAFQTENRAGTKSRQRAFSDRAFVYKAWPTSVVNTVRSTLRQQYCDMALDYKRQSSSTGPVWISTIETQALMITPSFHVKKSVQWDDSVYYSPQQPYSTSLFRSLFMWLISWLPFVCSNQQLRSSASASTSDGEERYEHSTLTETKPYPGPLDPLHPYGDNANRTPRSASPASTLIARLASAILVRMVRVLRWLELCALPFDDLTESVAAVSQPIPAQSRHFEHPGAVPYLDPNDVSPYTTSRSARTHTSSGGGYFSSTRASAIDPFGPRQQATMKSISSCRTHQDPSPLFEAIRSALTSHHPRPTYRPSLAASLSAYIYLLAPWVHSHLKFALAHHILSTTPADGHQEHNS